MGCTVREKQIRTNRRSRLVKPECNPCAYVDRASISESILESALKPLKYHLGHLGLNDSSQNPDSNSNNEDNNGWGYCTEEQLEEILLKNLELLYNEATNKLLTLGYDEDVALKAILRYGHCYRGMDVLTNMLHNSLAYLNSNSSTGGGISNGNSDEYETVFSNLRHVRLIDL